MQIYLVGGAVRDQLLGLTVKDRDWVVVGADASIMRQLGFHAVGKDFPVFLHPTTHEEYALARTERKTTKGYTGFVFHADQNVTLEQDLLRRDLTINAMAQSENGEIIDPFNGQNDLKNKILRHVSTAFTEDPVRILRTARFAARYDFHVADETMLLMHKMVKQGEVDALVAERVWQELSKGLMENHPRRMFEVLYKCKTLHIILPEIASLFEQNQMKTVFHALDFAAKNHFSLPERYATLLFLVNNINTINQRWCVPKSCAQLAQLVQQFHNDLRSHNPLNAEKILYVLQHCDAIRRRQRFELILNICSAIDTAQGHNFATNRQLWERYLCAVQNVDTRNIAMQYANNMPKQIADAIYQARIHAITEIL